MAFRLALGELVEQHLDLGRAPGRANTGDKLMTLVASALAGGDCIDDADALAHDLKLCLAQWPASEKRYEPAVLREQLGPLFERYPGLGLLTMDALYAERDLCQAIADHGRDYLVRIKGNRPEVLAALAEGFAGEGPGEPEAETVEKKRV